LQDLPAEREAIGLAFVDEKDLVSALRCGWSHAPLGVGLSTLAGRSLDELSGEVRAELMYLLHCVVSLLRARHVLPLLDDLEAGVEAASDFVQEGLQQGAQGVGDALLAWRHLLCLKVVKRQAQGLV
jgi:hypothetical protein